jgi:hypothetical protein
MSHHQNVGQNHNIKLANRTSRSVAKFKYLGMAVTNQNLIHEEIKSIKSYHSVQNLLSFCLLTLPLVLYGCETWSLTLREEHRLRVFKNRVLRRVFGLKRGEIIGGRRKFML